MASRDVSFVSGRISKTTVNVQSSQRTTTTSDDGGTTRSVTSQYHVRQADSGGPAGQVVDYKVQRDGQTGQPRVEMVFSTDSLQQQLPAQTAPAVTVYCYYLDKFTERRDTGGNRI